MKWPKHVGADYTRCPACRLEITLAGVVFVSILTAVALWIVR